MDVLIVEDNREIMETIADFLEAENVNVDFAYNGVEAINRVKAGQFDVIVMDIMMPSMDGVASLKQIRSEKLSSAPVLFLTALDSLDDKQRAYMAGGDDYLVKPFAMQELMLRLTALAKRGPIKDQTLCRVGKLQLDMERLALSIENKAIKLTNLQLHIVQILMQKSPAVVSREQILDAVWGDELPPSDALRSHIYSIRTALQKVGVAHYLHTVHGKGLQLVEC